METTIDINELDISFFEEIKRIYQNKKVKISIEEVKPFDELSGKEQLKRIKELRKKHPSFHVSKEINISQLANEVNL